MFRFIVWPLAAIFLIVVGLFPAAAAPVDLAFTGLAVIVAAIPGPVLLLTAVVVWLKHRPAPTRTA